MPSLCEWKREWLRATSPVTYAYLILPGDLKVGDMSSDAENTLPPKTFFAILPITGTASIYLR
jgi:hypothetical protein